jgi:hypothetical protein
MHILPDTRIRRVAPGGPISVIGDDCIPDISATASFRGQNENQTVSASLIVVISQRRYR